MATEMIVIFHHDERGCVRTWSEVGRLVRCKDCKYGEYESMSNAYWCAGVGRSGDYFCAEGERRDDAEQLPNDH